MKIQTWTRKKRNDLTLSQFFFLNATPFLGAHPAACIHYLYPSNRYMMYLRNHMSRIGWLSTIDKRRRRREKVDGKIWEIVEHVFIGARAPLWHFGVCRRSSNTHIENVIYNFIKRLNKISIYLKMTLGCTIGAEPSVHQHHRFRLSFAIWSRRRMCLSVHWKNIDAAMISCIAESHRDETDDFFPLCPFNQFQF